MSGSRGQMLELPSELLRVKWERSIPSKIDPLQTPPSPITPQRKWATEVCSLGAEPSPLPASRKWVGCGPWVRVHDPRL